MAERGEKRDPVSHRTPTQIIRRFVAGETQAVIVKALGLSKGAVAGVVFRYRKATEAASGAPQKPKPAAPAPIKLPPVELPPTDIPPTDNRVKDGPMVHIWELSAGQCKYSIGVDESGSHLFCADAVRDPQCAYCSTHAKLCYEKPIKRPVKRRGFNFNPLKHRHAIHDFAT